MRQWTVAAFLAAALSAVAPAGEARSVAHNANATFHGRTTATAARFVALSRNARVVFDRFSHRFMRVSPERFARSGFLDDWGLAPGWVDAEGFAGSDGIASADPSGAVASVPSAEAAANLPPCRETTDFGIVIERGASCRR